MQDLNDLYYFVQVVDHGGYAAAGRATRHAAIEAQPPHHRAGGAARRAAAAALDAQADGDRDRPGILPALRRHAGRGRRPRRKPSNAHAPGRRG